MGTRGEHGDKRRGTLYVLEDDPPATRPRWYCHWDGGSAPGFEIVEDAVSWGLKRARTVVVCTLGTVFYWAGDRPADWGDYDLEGPPRTWPPSAGERRAIDAAYAAAVAADRADSEARAAYEDARLSWLVEHVPELARDEPAHECLIELPRDERSIEFEELDLAGAVCGARCQGTGAYGFGTRRSGAGRGRRSRRRWSMDRCRGRSPGARAHLDALGTALDSGCEGSQR